MVNTDKNYYELRTHGTAKFPFELYEGDCSIYMDCYVHWHNEIEIIYVLDGMARVSINNQVVIGEKGDFIFIQPGVIHFIEGRIKGARILQFQTIVFHLGLLETSSTYCYQKELIQPLIERNAYIQNLIRPEHPCYNKIEKIYKDIISAYHHQPLYYECLITSLLFSFFINY